jgi:ectoine hydroxylase-related dioxygenase (phytanoyl-CoA dioxygenase family)
VAAGDLKRVEEAFDFEQWARLGFAIADRPVLASDVADLRSEYARLIRDFDELPHPPARYAIRWHRDMTSWQCLSAPRLLTFWVALDSVSPANGGMEFAAGSHSVEAAGRGDDADLDDYDGHPIVGPAGIISAHHCLTGHRSGPNTSPGDRIAMTLHYMDADLRYVPGTASDKHINVELIADRNNEIDEVYFPIVYGA